MMLKQKGFNAKTLIKLSSVNKERLIGLDSKLIESAQETNDFTKLNIDYVNES